MTISELIRALRNVILDNPKLAEASVWARCLDGPESKINGVTVSKGRIVLIEYRDD